VPLRREALHVVVILFVLWNRVPPHAHASKHDALFAADLVGFPFCWVSFFHVRYTLSLSRCIFSFAAFSTFSKQPFAEEGATSLTFGQKGHNFYREEFYTRRSLIINTFFTNNLTKLNKDAPSCTGRTKSKHTFASILCGRNEYRQQAMKERTHLQRQR